MFDQDAGAKHDWHPPTKSCASAIHSNLLVGIAGLLLSRCSATRSTIRIEELRLAQKLGQLRNVRRYPSRLILAEQLGCGAATGFVLEENVGKLLPGTVDYYEDPMLNVSANILAGPRWREAAFGHGGLFLTYSKRKLNQMGRLLIAAVLMLVLIGSSRGQERPSVPPPPPAPPPVRWPAPPPPTKQFNDMYWCGRAYYKSDTARALGRGSFPAVNCPQRGARVL
jgi:hypothetical protein